MSQIFAVVETQMSGLGLRPLRVAHELGFKTLFVTNNAERYMRLHGASEIFAHSTDEVVRADTNSVEAIAAALHGSCPPGQLQAVFTVSDYTLPLVTMVAQRLGLPTVDPQAAASARNKLRTRQICSAAGVPCPKFVWATSAAQVDQAAGEVGLPCVVKPMTDSGSIDVKLCRTLPEVQQHYEHIASTKVDYRGQARMPGALIEEYLLGYEVSVETVALDGEIHVLGVSDKPLGPHPYFAEIGATFPSILPDEVQQRCRRTAVDALRALGHDFGAAHTELKVTADGVKLIEVNARVGGDQMIDVIELAYGIPLLRELVLLHAGQRPNIVPTRRGGAALRSIVQQQAGCVRAIHGEDLARRLPGVVELQLHVQPGSRIAPLTSNLQLLGHLLTTAPTPAEASRLADAAIGQISLDIEPAAV